jgi:hypothetical protein
MRSPGIMKKVLSSMTQGISQVQAMVGSRGIQNARTLQFDDSESLYNSQ